MCLIDLDDVKNRKWCPPIDSTVKIFTFFVKPCPQILSPTMSKENIMKLPNFQTFFKSKFNESALKFNESALKNLLLNLTNLPLKI